MCVCVCDMHLQEQAPLASGGSGVCECQDKYMYVCL